MTDKQIIIDGVDVRGCKNFSCGICEEENKIPRTINHFTADCRMYPNCNYKQLKRKEQECEELRATLKVIADRPCLNINDCNGNCLPHCKWNAHKLAQEALKELE